MLATTTTFWKGGLEHLSHLDSAYRRIYQGINFRLRTLAGGRYSSACRPTSIAILLTERCNARCIHCDIWKNRGAENSLDFEAWKRVLADLRSWLGPVHVVLSGGEALFRRYALDLVEFGAKTGLYIELLTHGFWDDDTKFEKLALAKPGRVTFSFDGLGDTHNQIRGRDNFFDRTSHNIEVLNRVRKERRLKFVIRLKTVVMDQNLDDVGKIAKYANQQGLEVFYQPIEQNYNTAENARWFLTSQTWPKDSDRAVSAVEEIIRLKKSGLPVANSVTQLEAMIPYFRDPAKSRVAIQSHSAHEAAQLCSGLTMLQIQADGRVLICSSQPEVGNVREKPIREIWENRPQWWTGGCCLEQRQ